MLFQINRFLNRAKDLLFLSPLLPIWRAKLNGKAMVYLYHRIGEIGEHEFLDEGGSPITTPAEFRQDIQSLKEMGATFIRFSDLLNCSYDPKAFYVVICVDDGFASNYTVGQTICEQEGISQTTFQCSAMIETDQLIWEHQLYYLLFSSHLSEGFSNFVQENASWPDNCDSIRKKISPKEIRSVIDKYVLLYPELNNEFSKLARSLYPTIKQVQVAQKKHEIASHGNNHFYRKTINQHEFIKELKDSSDQLNDILEDEIHAFSYPFNSYKKDDSKLVERFYSIAATVDGGFVDAHTNFLTIPRNTFPGTAKNKLRHNRWLFTGHL